LEEALDLLADLAVDGEHAGVQRVADVGDGVGGGLLAGAHFDASGFEVHDLLVELAQDLDQALVELGPEGLAVAGALGLGLLDAALVVAVALPAASLVSILLAAAVAFYAYRARVNYRSQGLTFWDLAGMLALIGFGAGAMSEPLAALELFGMSTTR